MSNPFDVGSPFNGLPDALKPNPPVDAPKPQAAGDATAYMSPFTKALDYEAIKRNLVLDRPLKLFIPEKFKNPDFQYRIINNIPQEIADAYNKGWREVTNPEMAELFNELVAGTTKEGKAYRPMLMARPKSIGLHIANERRKQLASLYAGMDPRNKEFTSKFAENVVSGPDASKGQFTGDGFRIRMGKQ